MGCISSKQARSSSPDFVLSVAVDRENGLLANVDSLSSRSRRSGFGELGKIKEESEKERGDESVGRNGDLKKSKSTKKGSSEKKAAFSLKFGRYIEAEQIAAGWPPWLSAVAGEAVEGWLPLRSELFEKLDKIGQGTYSTVYRARNVETGGIVALKKVRFDTFQPESVRFMAREIAILRRLDHPNVMKLEGLITSRLSCSIYFVFEYMEHDLSGLSSSPDIKFSDAQIKCYMRQLLSGVEHCHSRGVIHRDIKTSNILVNNEGILKLGDFGLANLLSARHRQPLTSRVVTLWYRPPELLLGSTNYGASVDLWSVGCVFAELFIKKPILKGRTEVEQLHKIFKLCGSPTDEFWKRTKLPLSTMFKPQNPYESTLRQRCKEFPKTAVKLIETFLSVEPYKRGTASTALDSEYFATRPYACDPSSLPKYPPNKEMDAKLREEARRRKGGGRLRASGASRNLRRTRKALQESSTLRKVVPTEAMEASTQFARRNNGSNAHLPKGATDGRATMTGSYDTVSEASQLTELSQGNSIHSVPIQVSASSGFAWAKGWKGDAASTRLYGQANSRSQNMSELEPSSILHAKDMLDSTGQENEEFLNRVHSDLRGCDSFEIANHAMRRQLNQLDRPESFDASDLYLSQELSADYNDQQRSVQYSGPLLSQSHSMDERQESHIRQAVGRSRFYRDL
ncbi:protein IMPAIRED IN BABA-INDUCED STERILITY 1-like [Cornus florida]|uniref:protein IMPAIRED IN BABA-INDUCED STERILITY 1-like n=1 Tax=Cornus florida TaxID=4283 RepID=UPI00289D810A|nr:protein IMPAIRED IN BABA-INDUCED STERILITY 1-like [Cornus florida]